MADSLDPARPNRDSTPGGGIKSVWPCFVGGPVLAALIFAFPWSVFKQVSFAVGNGLLGAVAAVFAAVMWSPQGSAFVFLSVIFSCACVLAKTKGRPKHVTRWVASMALSGVFLFVLGAELLDQKRNRITVFAMPEVTSLAQKFDTLSYAEVEKLAQLGGSSFSSASNRIRMAGLGPAKDTEEVVGERSKKWSVEERRFVAMMAYRMDVFATYPTCKRIQQGYQASPSAVRDHYALTIQGRIVPTSPSGSHCRVWGFNEIGLSVKKSAKT